MDNIALASDSEVVRHEKDAPHPRDLNHKTGLLLAVGVAKKFFFGGVTT